MKNILLPTDFSENAWNAIDYAFQMFAIEADHFYMFNSYTPPTIQPTSGITSSKNTKILADMARKASEDGLEEIKKRIKDNYPDLVPKIKIISTYDTFVSGVKSAVKEFEIDLIVMGTKGSSGVKEVIIGSNTAGVIGHVTCSVLAIPESAKYKPVKEITFATEYDLYWEQSELNTMLQIAKKSDAAIRVLHALESRNELKEEQIRVKEYLDGVLNGIPHTYHTLSKLSLESAVRAFTESREVDMLCMVARHHNFFQRIFGKPRVEEISFHIQIPYLVLHEYTRR
ncbi:universal stress protein [Zhouia spongiae]|uniref:Universal stress protein n=1 Tax=Zhouia spongiae TaxID=2202721 RepID=A0ABY3YJT5_9FLAO|nr:universal stress protein [Zhouia spongiae]UNY98074.1 universal stress protein [Zhouia spongiae]